MKFLKLLGSGNTNTEMSYRLIDILYMYDIRVLATGSLNCLIIDLNQ